MKTTDTHYMRQALEEARAAGERGEVPVGAVVVAEERIIARGHNLTQTLCDVTAHAEMQAITAAAQYMGAKYLKDCVLYVTLEPCAMCAGAMAWAQLGRLVYGASDPKKGYSLLSGRILHPQTAVERGVLEEECGELLRAFFQGKRK